MIKVVPKYEIPFEIDKFISVHITSYLHFTGCIPVGLSD
jgi:hypothetical protein